MFGAIIGDIVGSVYEFNNIKSKDFPFWTKGSHFTDDTVMTCAVCAALREYKNDTTKNAHALIIARMQEFGREYPFCGYGTMFAKWIHSDRPGPYNSYGNGSAMRVSSAAWIADSIEEAKEFAKYSAEVTHNHPDGIKGAVSIAEAIYMGINKATKPQIKEAMENYYSLDFTLDEIRENYEFDETCEGSVPQAIVAFLEGKNFEDVIRNAVSIGGDSDTIAAIAGSIAEPVFGIPARMKARAINILDPLLKKAIGIID